jgi:hypothetical protein
MTSTRLGWRLLISSLTLPAVTVLLFGCSTADAQRDSSEEAVVVEPVSDDDDGGITEAQLDDQLRRYADRFITRVTLATNTIANELPTPAEQLVMHQWKAVSMSTIVELAIGDNAVTNLLDMMVLTTLTRQTLENYWIPERFGEDGQPLLDSYIVLEDDIWSIADRVLTPQQQDDLTSLLEEWSRDNPEQVYPWYIRLNEFSGQRAASLQEAQQSGGLLSTVRQTRETVEEVQEFGERILFYLHRAPLIASYSMQGSVMELLQGPEITGLVNDTNRITTSVEEMVDVVAQLPNDRIMAIDQFMEQLATERVAIFDDLEGMGSDAETVATELRLTLESFERILLLLNVDAPRGGDADGPQFDIANFEAFARQAAVSAAELRLLVESADALISSPGWQNWESMRFGAFEQILEVEAVVINRSFALTGLLILLFFATLLGYRVLAARLVRS